MKPPKEIYEKLASIQHDIWAHWMRYLFSCCEKTKSGGYKIPEDKVKHWLRQMNFKYEQLTAREKDSDRSQVDKFIKYLHSTKDGE